MLDSPLRIRLHRPLCIAALTCSLVAICVTAGIGLWIAFSNVPIIGAAEPNVIYTLEKYLAGRPLYGDPDQLPFDVTQYSPLFYVVAGTVGKLFHVEPTNAEAVLRLGRLTAFVFSVSLLCIQYRLLTHVLLVHRAISAPAMAYSYLVTCPYLFYARPDTALALTTLACLFFLLKSTTQAGGAATWSIAFGTVCAFLALMSKQSGVVVVVIVFAYLLLSRQYRPFFVAGAVLCLCVSVSILVIGSYDDADVLKSNVIDGLNNGFDYYHAVINVLLPYVRSETVLIVATGYLMLCWLNRGASRAELLLAIALPALLGFAVVTSLKSGSGPNYYNEFDLVATTAIAYAVQQRFEYTRFSNPPDWLIAVLALYVVLVLPVRTLEKAYMFTYGRSEARSLRPLLYTQYAAYEELVGFLEANTDPSRNEYVLTFDRGLMTMIPFRSVTPHTDLASIRYQRGLADFSRFRTLVTAGQVKYVVFLKGEIWEDYLGVRFLDYFEHLRDYENQSVYRYRGPK